MHVYDQTELEKHLKLGWTPEVPKEKTPNVVVPPQTVEKKKPGRPKKGA
jgi:hypothetical protein